MDFDLITAQNGFVAQASARRAQTKRDTHPVLFVLKRFGGKLNAGVVDLSDLPDKRLWMGVARSIAEGSGAPEAERALAIPDGIILLCEAWSALYKDGEKFEDMAPREHPERRETIWCVLESPSDRRVVTVEIASDGTLGPPRVIAAKFANALVGDMVGFYPSMRGPTSI